MKTFLEDLLDEARRNVKATNRCADLCLRIAADKRATEQMRIREMGRRFASKYGRPPRKPLPAGHTAQVIPFPADRAFMRIIAESRR